MAKIHKRVTRNKTHTTLCGIPYVLNDKVTPKVTNASPRTASVTCGRCLKSLEKANGGK